MSRIIDRFGTGVYQFGGGDSDGDPLFGEFPQHVLVAQSAATLITTLSPVDVPDTSV